MPSVEALEELTSGAIQVLGGTSGVWARQDFNDSVDVLFVDEAGQMSLANVVSVSRAARSLVLLGDPRQLEQPQKGSHRDGADAAALQHILGQHLTIPAGQPSSFRSRGGWRRAFVSIRQSCFMRGSCGRGRGSRISGWRGTDRFDGAGL